MKKFDRRIWSLATLFFLGVSVYALAELMGPLGKVMHTLSSDLSCLDKPNDGFSCSGTSPQAALTEMIHEAQLLHDNPSLVTQVVPGADAAVVQSMALELLASLNQVQAAITSGNATQQAQAVLNVHATMKAAHARFRPGH